MQTIHAIGVMSFLMFLVISFGLLCVIAFAGHDFWNRHDWLEPKVNSLTQKSLQERIDLGRLVFFWLYRIWCLLFILTILYLFGGKYVT
jgi:hypothetical protein